MTFVLVPLERPTTEASEQPDVRFRLSAPSDGVLFDIDADGRLEHVAWPRPEARVALLAIDRNGNGQIDNGSEFFGAQTLPDVSWAFAALAQIEPHDGDGAITQDDPVFVRLLLWHDRNADGRSSPEELIPASRLFGKIGLGYSGVAHSDGFGSKYESRGWAVFLRDMAGKPDDVVIPIFEVAPARTRQAKDRF